MDRKPLFRAFTSTAAEPVSTVPELSDDDPAVLDCDSREFCAECGSVLGLDGFCEDCAGAEDDDELTVH